MVIIVMIMEAVVSAVEVIILTVVNSTMLGVVIFTVVIMVAVKT